MSLPLEPPSKLPPQPTLQVFPEPLFEFPESYRKFLLTIYFTYGNISFHVTLSKRLILSFLPLPHHVAKSVLYVCFSFERKSLSVISDSLRPHGLQPARLLCPWDSPGKNTGVGCCAFLQWIFPNQRSNPGLPHCRWILYHLSHEGSCAVNKFIGPIFLDSMSMLQCIFIFQSLTYVTLYNRLQVHPPQQN